VEKLEKILREHARFIDISSSIQSNMALASLGIDSLDIIELIVKIEDEFDLEIPSEQVTPDTFSTPGSIWRLLCQIDPKLVES
jgi:acyl carrier protein